MIDAHCHIDLYPDPTQAALKAERAGVFTVLVTNLPSAFQAAAPHVTRFRNIRLALGLHPLNASVHSEKELRLFETLVRTTSFIGEVGLDFSREGVHTRGKQLASFRFALRCLTGIPKFVTVHSRQAESAVLEVVAEEYRRPVVFHWYSGSLKSLDLAITSGHYFSVNPAMVESKKGQSIVDRIPQDRLLTETDGPFVRIGARPAEPADVQSVERYLSNVWSIEAAEVRRTVLQNFHRVLGPVKAHLR